MMNHKIDPDEEEDDRKTNLVRSEACREQAPALLWCIHLLAAGLVVELRWRADGVVCQKPITFRQQKFRRIFSLGFVGLMCAAQVRWCLRGMQELHCCWRE